MNIQDNEVMIFPEAKALYEYAAQDFMQRAIAAVNHKNKFTVALSGGNTPRNFFSLLASDPYKDLIPWPQIVFFFGDERYVPADDEQSNYHMADTLLFSKVPVNKENIYRMKTEFDHPDDAALDYEKTLRKVLKATDNTIPQLDLIYLGLGKDAHTASLMPQSELVQSIVDNKIPALQLAAALYVESLDMHRITLTPHVINNATAVIFLEQGEGKAEATKKVLSNKDNPLLYPAQLIKCVHAKTLWYLDQAAAKQL